MVEELACDRGGEYGVAGGDGADGVDDLVGGGVLEQEAAGARPQRLDDVLVSPNVVRMRTRWRGSRRVASMPSITGMRMSIRTTSGR